MFTHDTMNLLYAISAACALVYPVRDGIPVMLLEEAVPLERWRASHPAV